jgi:hypothetical protein
MSSTYAEEIERRYGPCRDASIEVARAMERFLDELQKIPPTMRPVALNIIETMCEFALDSARKIAARPQ